MTRGGAAQPGRRAGDLHALAHARPRRRRVGHRSGRAGWADGADQAESRPAEHGRHHRSAFDRKALRAHPRRDLPLDPARSRRRPRRPGMGRRRSETRIRRGGCGTGQERARGARACARVPERLSGRCCRRSSVVERALGIAASRRGNSAVNTAQIRGKLRGRALCRSRAKPASRREGVETGRAGPKARERYGQGTVRLATRVERPRRAKGEVGSSILPAGTTRPSARSPDAEPAAANAASWRAPPSARRSTAGPPRRPSPAGPSSADRARLLSSTWSPRGVAGSRRRWRRRTVEPLRRRRVPLRPYVLRAPQPAAEGRQARRRRLKSAARAGSSRVTMLHHADRP